MPNHYINQCSVIKFSDYKSILECYWSEYNIGRGNNVNKKEESEMREIIICYAEKLILDVAKTNCGKEYSV